jgi:hypothetical protein
VFWYLQSIPPDSLLTLSFPHQCVLGYCLFPLLLASVVALVLHNLFIRVPISLAAWAWCVWGECCAPPCPLGRGGRQARQYANTAFVAEPLTVIFPRAPLLSQHR